MCRQRRLDEATVSFPYSDQRTEETEGVYGMGYTAAAVGYNDYRHSRTMLISN